MLKINPELYIGSLELRRAFEAIQESGYKKLFSAFVQSFGVAYTTPTSLQVVQGTAGARWLSVRAGLAVDQDLNLIYSDSDISNGIEFPDSLTTRYLCIRWKKREIEKGTITVATDGSVTGAGTEFTKVLRGAPLNQVKIRLPNSSNNLNDYPVLEVIDDTHATLNSVASITAESGQQYSVVGCFTPGVSIPEQNKVIYSYDDYELFLSSQVGSDGYSFRLAQVSWNGSNLTIVDIRTNNQLKLFDTTADLVNQITQSVITQYNLQITTQFAAQIAALNSAVSALTVSDSNFATQLANLEAVVATKAGLSQESWRYFADPGEPDFGPKFTNAITGVNRSKFMKTTTGTVHVSVFINANLDVTFGDTLFTMPAGYRFNAQQYAIVSKWTGTGFPSLSFVSFDENGNFLYKDSADLLAGQKLQFYVSYQI